MENTTIPSVLLSMDCKAQPGFLNFVLFIVLAVLYTLATAAFRRPHRLPPGPTPWPMVGSIFTMVRQKSRSRWVLSLAEGGKDIACVRLGRQGHSMLLTPEEIKAKIAELVYATVDNASNIVEWTMALLLNHRDIMARAVQELDRVVGKDRLVQDSDFTHLTFTKACAREALRLHPSAPFNLPHVSTCDVTVAGYVIPEGSHVLISRVGPSHNPKVWPNPLSFDPDRHVRDGSGGVELVELGLRFISFSLGCRGCPATQLGTQITYMLLATLLLAFEWRSNPESGMDLSVEENSGFMVKPLHACATPRLDKLHNISYDM